MFRMLAPLILASRSPRRSRLLLSAGVVFEVHPSEIEEPVPAAGVPGKGGAAATAQRCARLKAESVSAVYPCAWVLGADTIVVSEGRIFGKPRDAAEAVCMLATLNDREHEVITGICLAGPAGKGSRTGSVATRVRFKALSRGEIEAYARTGEPMDKAGAYGIQDAGAFLVRCVEGSYTNVVGLPLSEVIDWLMDENIIEPA